MDAMKGWVLGRPLPDIGVVAHPERQENCQRDEVDGGVVHETTFVKVLNESTPFLPTTGHHLQYIPCGNSQKHKRQEGRFRQP